MAPDLLVSPFGPEECLRRIRAATDIEWRFSSRPVIGWVGKTSARIRKRLSYRNSFQTVMRIKATATAEQGTLLVCRSGMAYVVQSFLALWLGFLVLIAAAITLPAITGRMRLEASPVVAIGAPLLMAAFGVCLVVIGRRMAKDEREFLLHFLAVIIKARPQ